MGPSSAQARTSLHVQSDAEGKPREHTGVHVPPERPELRTALKGAHQVRCGGSSECVVQSRHLQLRWLVTLALKRCLPYRGRSFAIIRNSLSHSAGVSSLHVIARHIAHHTPHHITQHCSTAHHTAHTTRHTPHDTHHMTHTTRHTPHGTHNFTVFPDELLSLCPLHQQPVDRTVHYSSHTWSPHVIECRRTMALSLP